jgi:hypothetical protein
MNMCYEGLKLESKYSQPRFLYHQLNPKTNSTTFTVQLCTEHTQLSYIFVKTSYVKTPLSNTNINSCV